MPDIQPFLIAGRGADTAKESDSRLPVARTDDRCLAAFLPHGLPQKAGRSLFTISYQQASFTPHG